MVARLAVALALASTTVHAAEWHVDAEAGDDGAAGSADAPFATLQHAANQVSAGDTVLVNPGS